MRHSLASQPVASAVTEGRVASQRPAPVSGDYYLQPSSEAVLLKIDLSDLTLPQVNNLQVDGLQKSWWARMLGR